MDATVNMYHHAFWVRESAPEPLRNHYGQLLQQSGFLILNFMEHHFQPQGYTAIWLLGESHLAIHTFPEENRSYVELSSCNKEKYDQFLQAIKSKTLNPKP